MLVLYDRKKHQEALCKMLKTEGLPEVSHRYDHKDYKTFVEENSDGKVIGFFSFNFLHGRPNLLHFCVARDSRGTKTARTLVKLFRFVVVSLGFSDAILHVKKGNTKMRKIIEYYFKCKPYTKCTVDVDGIGKQVRDYYLVRV